MSGAPERISVVVPCYHARDTVLDVLAAIGPAVARVYVVDDGCPEHTGQHVRRHCGDPRVQVLFNERNLGVGGATLRGYRAALADNSEVVVKLDADGQVDPALIPGLAAPVLAGRCDYAKGNRFFDLRYLRDMPASRLFGNAALSLVTKLSSGYWPVMDPTNGFTAIHKRVLAHLPLERLAHDWFFESDMLFRLGILRAVVLDVPMPARYGAERSLLRITQVLARFPLEHLHRFVKRLFYGYFLREFNAGTVQLVCGLPLLLFGVVFGAINWYSHASAGLPAPVGTIMLAVLPIVLGMQLLLGALAYDIANLPRQPLHPDLPEWPPPHAERSS